MTVKEAFTLKPGDPVQGAVSGALYTVVKRTPQGIVIRTEKEHLQALLPPAAIEFPDACRKEKAA